MKHLAEIVEMAKAKGKRRLVVAAADDVVVLKAVLGSVNQGIILPVLVGDKHKIVKISNEIGLDISSVRIVDEPDPDATAKIAVALINQGEADILMKGLLGTAPLLKAVVDREHGLRKSTLLSHFTLFESSYYHKLFGAADVAMNIAPTLDEKIQIINNSVEVMQKLGVSVPKVAIIGPVETINEKIESTVHAALLTVMNKRKQIKGCIIDGPLSLDNAISAEATSHKQIVSEVAGDADLLIVPDLDSGNILYKSLTFMGGALSAAIVTGASAPIVLTSRASDEESKILSIALAAAVG